MFVGSFFVFVTILTSVYGTCQSLDGQSVPWWILYQQKERPFFHQYVESTNSHRVKVFTNEFLQNNIRQNKEREYKTKIDKIVGWNIFE